MLYNGTLIKNSCNIIRPIIYAYEIINTVLDDFIGISNKILISILGFCFCCHYDVKYLPL